MAIHIEWAQIPEEQVHAFDTLTLPTCLWACISVHLGPRGLNQLAPQGRFTLILQAKFVG